jgi:hypothetical protein
MPEPSRAPPLDYQRADGLGEEVAVRELAADRMAADRMTG